MQWDTIAWCRDAGILLDDYDSSRSSSSSSSNWLSCELLISRHSLGADVDVITHSAVGTTPAFDPADKRYIICDEAMQKVFKTDRVHMFTMNKLLSEHLHKKEEA